MKGEYWKHRRPVFVLGEPGLAEGGADSEVRRVPVRAEPSESGRSGRGLGHGDGDRGQCQCGQDHRDAQLSSRQQSADGAVGVQVDVLTRVLQ